MANAVSALFYLWSRSLLNIFRAKLRRLRQPKYLLGAVVALGYIFLVFIYPQQMIQRTRAELPPREPVDFSASATSLISLALFLMFLFHWLWRRDRSSLNFTEAEIAHFFPAPIAHAVLVHYSLIRTQLAMLFTAFMMAFFTANVPFLSGPFWVRFIGWWLLISVVTLHYTASGWTLTRLLHRGLAQWQRQWLLGALCVLAFWSLFHFNEQLHLPTPAETALPENFFAYLRQQTDSGALYWLLLPLRLIVKPLVATDAIAFVQALVPALVVYSLFYYWAFKSEVPDPEAALAKAAKRAGMLVAFRKGKLGLAPELVKARAQPFKLNAQGSPAMAFLWKNLLSTREYFSLRNALVVAAFLVAWSFWVNRDSHPGYLLVNEMMLGLTGVMGLQIFLFGSVFARQDLRNDLDNADVIKTYPLAGWQIVLGELLAPALILTILLWLCLLELFLGMEFHPPEMTWVTPEFRILTGISVALVLPFLVAIQLFMANAAVVLFPAWTKTAGFQGNQGLDVAGQRLLFFAAQLLALLAALLPALMFGLLVYLPVQLFLHEYALLPAAIVTAVVLAGELAWGINWLGERFDAYDLTA